MKEALKYQGMLSKLPRRVLGKLVRLSVSYFILTVCQLMDESTVTNEASIQTIQEIPRKSK